MQLRSRLLVSLLILIAVVLAPVLAVVWALQADAAAALNTHLARDAMRQLALLEGDLGKVLDGARLVGVVVSQEPDVHALRPACASFLVGLRNTLPAYAALTVFADDGAPVCTTLARHDEAVRLGQSANFRHALQAGGLDVGTLIAANAERGAVLPVSLPFASVDGLHHGVVMLALNLQWLQSQLAERDLPPNASIGIADRAGRTLVRYPVPTSLGPSFVGKPMPPAILPYVNARRRGTTRAVGVDGQGRLVAYVPVGDSLGGGSLGAGPHGTGLFITISVPTSLLASAAAIARAHVVLLLLCGATASIGLGLVVGVLLIGRPVHGLLQVARRWASGDLSVTAPVRGGGTELNELAELFVTIGRRQRAQVAELKDLHASFDARVGERTRDLVESRNRLQTEVTERARTDAELRRAQKLQVVGQLAGGIAHHFNNLLTAVVGSLEILRRRIPDLPGRGDAARADSNLQLISLVGGALQAAGRGTRLTGQLLTFSRAQRMLPEPTDLNAVIAGLSDLLVGTLGRGIRIDTELAPADVPGMGPVMVDPGQLEIALMNLAINAHDAMNGSGVLTICTEPVHLPEVLPMGAIASPGAFVAIHVRDTGDGIPADVIAKVFEPFFTTKPAGRGSGLGLAQVQTMATQSGGDVRIASRAGNGTAVTLLLPRAAAVALTPPTAIAAPVAGDRGCRKLRILLVDDDRLVGEITAEMITERGHFVTRAADAAEALALLRLARDGHGGSYDLLLTDYVMPGMNGLALIGEARLLRPTLRSLLMTGHASFDPGAAVAAEGIIRKPFTMAHLFERIEAVTAPHLGVVRGDGA